MDLSRRAALRATLSGLHAGAVLAGTECVLVWAAFRWTPAAIVGGLAYVVGGVFALLAYPRTVARTRRVILMRGLRVYVYSVALITAGALLVRSGSHRMAVDRMSATAADEERAGRASRLNGMIAMAKLKGASSLASDATRKNITGHELRATREVSSRLPEVPQCCARRRSTGR